ncbi:MAG TPA: hypothetical protein VMR50_16995 [Myxococcota bacterium]|nr:hypothetical protein [Myxococcota bacterium]
MGPARSVSRAAVALFALVALSSSDLGHAETQSQEISALKAELAATKGELAKTQSALDALEAKVEALASNGAGAPAAAPPPGASDTARIAPVNADNPGISFVVDGQFGTNTQGEQGAGFLLGTGELFISAPIDPFLRGYASINGTTDQGFDVEEAALVTTALPWNLTVKGGRFFADFGRFPHWHDEALPFVNRPASIDKLIGGESQSEGVEVSWLAPMDQYLDVTVGVYNSMGAARFDDPGAFGTGKGQRSFSELSYLVHPTTYFDLTDTLNLELGGSYLAVPTGAKRGLYGVDATLRHQPGTSEFYQGTDVGVEWLWNSERFDGVAVASDPVTGEAIVGSGRFHRDGGYAYFESFFGRRFSVGGRFDYAENPFGDKDLQRTYSAFVTWKPSEFQRLRLQWDDVGIDGPNDQRFTLQWTAFIGSHSHGFAMR